MCINCIVRYKNKCYLHCPENTCIKKDVYLNTCIDIEPNTKIINEICFENFQDYLNNINITKENNVIIDKSQDLTIYAYKIERNINYFEENNLTYIYFKDIQDILIKEFNLDDNANIYALIVDSVSKYSNSTINDYGFVLLLDNGTELDLSKINEDLKVTISIPIINLDLAKFNYATIFSEQGYDIYDINSAFYHDICTPGYLNDNDLTLEDRKKDIYINNITAGKSNCEYQLTDLNNKRFIYNCYLIEINKNNTDNNNVNSFDEEKNENMINYILDVINYKVLICSNLFMNLDNFRHNKAVMICTTSIFLANLLLIIFFCHRIPKIRIKIFKEIPSSPKVLKINKREKKNFINSSNILSSQDKIISIIKDEYIPKKTKKKSQISNHGGLKINKETSSNKVKKLILDNSKNNIKKIKKIKIIIIKAIIII